MIVQLKLPKLRKTVKRRKNFLEARNQPREPHHHKKIHSLLRNKHKRKDQLPRMVRAVLQRRRNPLMKNKNLNLMNLIRSLLHFKELESSKMQQQQN